MARNGHPVEAVEVVTWEVYCELLLSRRHLERSSVRSAPEGLVDVETGRTYVLAPDDTDLVGVA